MMRRVLLTILLVVVASSSGYAQSTASEGPGLSGTEPEDPVFWWTLTDELSPEELRAIYEDAELHRVRYRQAAEAGYREPLPEDRLKAITEFVTGSMTPELFPMWLAFDAFSAHFHGENRWEAFAKAPTQLAKYGIDDPAAQSIIDSALRQLDESQALARELASDTLLFVALAREAKANKVGARTLNESIARGDPNTIALATGHSPAVVAKLMKTWRREPVRETIVVILPELKSKLSNANWERFRLFLLKEVAPMMSGIDFSKSEE